MAILNILHFPDDRLRTKAQPVAEVTDQHRTLIKNMLETMYDAPGIGLAATQVNVHERILVIDISEDKNEPIALINPEIVEKDGDQEFDAGPQTGAQDEQVASTGSRPAFSQSGPYPRAGR